MCATGPISLLSFAAIHSHASDIPLCGVSVLPNRDIIVVGASAGGVEALQQLCAGFPSDLQASVLIVIHTSSNAGGLLPRILTRAGPLPAKHPRNGERIQKGHIYVAPPDLHMVVERGRLLTVRGPRENKHRPAIDPTFRSAALHYGPRVIGVVCTGLLDDGTSGLMVIHAQGGLAVVQDPATATFPSMPRNAIERVPDALVVPLSELPARLAELTMEQVPDQSVPERQDSPLVSEVQFAELDMSEIDKDVHSGKPSPFACPECGGVLWEIEQQGLLRFRCRVGHAYTEQHLRTEHRHHIETALWSALRALEESASLYRRLAERAEGSRLLQASRQYKERATTAQGNAHTLREFLVKVNVPAEALSPQELDTA
jgi:two-component system, chemotaxis family, protein-glutamate methylesterase/glutaminase